jgi:hypothetical protein
MASPFKLNNEAAHFIKNEAYGEAVSLLQKAMKKVRLAISGDLRPGLYRASSDESSGDEGEGDFCRFLASDDSSCFSKPASDGDRHSIFSSPILLNRGVDLWDAASCEHFSYVVVYNLALAHHLMATTTHITRRTSRILLQRCLSLYENAHYVLMRSPDMDVSVLHSLAIWTNLGHVHDVLGQGEKSELCYRHLLSTIFYIVDSERGVDSVGDAIPIDGFFSNVMSLLKNETVAPAA